MKKNLFSNVTQNTERKKRVDCSQHPSSLKNTLSVKLYAIVTLFPALLESRMLPT